MNEKNENGSSFITSTKESAACHGLLPSHCLGRIVNGIRCLDIQGDHLSTERLHKDLHAATKSEHQVESSLFLDVIGR